MDGEEVLFSIVCFMVEIGQDGVIHCLHIVCKARFESVVFVISMNHGSTKTSSYLPT